MVDKKDGVNQNSDTKVCKGRIQQFSNSFAAGLLLSLSFVHILPEALKARKTYLLEHAAEHGHDHRRRLLDLSARILAETANTTN